MKRETSLKTKLVVSITAVLVIVMAVLGALFLVLIGNIDARLLETIEARALANARAIGVDVGYGAMIADEGEAKAAEAKLKDFARNHQETHSATVLVAKDGPESVGKGNATYREFVVLGQPVDALALLGLVKNPLKGGSALRKHLIVAVAPALAEQQATGLVVYTESLADYFRFKSRLQLYALGAMLVCLLIAVGVVYLVGGRTARPINRLVDTAERLAAGDLRDIRIDAAGSAETQRLGGAIKGMAEALQEQVAGIQKLTSDINAVTREVAQAMAHLSSSASEQAAAVAETASTVEEMEQAGKSAAANANQIADASEKTTEASIRGRAAVDTTSQLILRIKDDSQEISTKSKLLLTNLEEVGNIIGSVNSIAEQSKILAVNASIEAAKAGEYGMGFAVVAQEVKDLAQQSKEATLQITGTLSSIRHAIENMVGTAAGGERRTEEGVRTVANAGAIVNDLSEAIRENAEFATVIATSVNQQTLGLTQIASAIEQINISALENQEISRKIEDGIHRLSTSMERLSDLVGRWKTAGRDA
jgi:methyl-accepting chemotaxis protein